MNLNLKLVQDKTSINLVLDTLQFYSGSIEQVKDKEEVVSKFKHYILSNFVYNHYHLVQPISNDGITDTLGISSTKETALKAQDGRTNILVESSQALRVQSVQKQLSIHGIRKVLGTLNEEADKLEYCKL